MKVKKKKKKKIKKSKIKRSGPLSPKPIHSFVISGKTLKAFLVRAVKKWNDRKQREDRKVRG